MIDSTPMIAHRPLRLVWDGTGDDGRVVPDGKYRLRVALRKENRSATVQKTTTVDTRAPKSEVCVGVPCSDTKNVANIVSQGDRRIKIFIKGVSPNYATKFRLYRTDTGKPELVANLPGSLKQLSLNYYVKSLLYNEATAAVTTATPESLDVYAPADPVTAWVTLLAAACGLTLLGMYLFGRQEPRDET